ncbi:hypothetical protein, partial [Paenibacillus macerans]|uniref:hypothetical protein n=1 Tax=Paenibacillus macerans TaxID=44252 RepID=UPI0022E8308D
MKIYNSTFGATRTKSNELQKCRRISSKFLEKGGSTAKVHFRSGQKYLIYRTAPKEMLLHFNRSKMA